MPESEQSSTIDNKQAQLEFPDDYESRIYYRDGWYVKPKDPSAVSKTIQSLEAGSTYKIELKPQRKEMWIIKGIIGIAIALTFFLAR